MCGSGSSGSSRSDWRGCVIVPGAAASRSFPPEVAMHAVKIACERPDDVGRSLSQWDCTEIARQLVRDGVVASISAETVRQILLHHRLKPWRQKMWLSAKVPRDAAFAAQVHEVCDLYTRPLSPDEVVLCVDEMTAIPGQLPEQNGKIESATLGQLRGCFVLCSVVPVNLITKTWIRNS